MTKLDLIPRPDNKVVTCHIRNSCLIGEWISGVVVSVVEPGLVVSWIWRKDVGEKDIKQDFFMSSRGGLVRWGINFLIQ